MASWWWVRAGFDPCAVRGDGARPPRRTARAVESVDGGVGGGAASVACDWMRAARQERAGAAGPAAETDGVAPETDGSGAGDGRPGLGDGQPDRGDRRLGRGDGRPGHGDRQPGHGDRQPDRGDRQPDRSLGEGGAPAGDDEKGARSRARSDSVAEKGGDVSPLAPGRSRPPGPPTRFRPVPAADPPPCPFRSPRTGGTEGRPPLRYVRPVFRPPFPPRRSLIALC